MVRYEKFLSEGVDIHVLDGADTVNISIDFLFKDYPSLLPFFGIVGMANLLAMCRLIYGKKLCPLKVTFKQTKPECLDEFYAYFKSDLRFGMDKDSIIFPADILDKALSGHNPTMTKYADQVDTTEFSIEQVSMFERRQEIDTVLNSSEQRHRALRPQCAAIFLI